MSATAISKSVKNFSSELGVNFNLTKKQSWSRLAVYLLLYLRLRYLSLSWERKETVAHLG